VALLATRLYGGAIAFFRNRHFEALL